jgi:hypothetical protein
MQPTVRHDLDELRRRKIAVPAAFQRGAWLTRPLGHAGGPGIGPSATQLLLWLPVRADAAAADEPAAPSWSEIGAVLGARGAMTSRDVPADAAALWDAGGAPDATATGERCTVRGAEYPSAPSAFGNIFWKHGWVLGTRAGLLISLVND